LIRSDPNGGRIKKMKKSKSQKRVRFQTDGEIEGFKEFREKSGRVKSLKRGKKGNYRADYDQGKGNFGFNEWDQDLDFKAFEKTKEKSVRFKDEKGSKKRSRSQKSKEEKKKAKEESPKLKTTEERYKEFKKKKLLENNYKSYDIDDEFKSIPKRFRTRITK
jgi:hypothetical protein